MSLREKLRQKQLLRQAAGPSLEALLGGSAAAPSSSNGGTTSSNVSNGRRVVPGVSGAPAAPAADSPAAPPQLPRHPASNAAPAASAEHVLASACPCIVGAAAVLATGAGGASSAATAATVSSPGCSATLNGRGEHAASLHHRNGVVNGCSSSATSPFDASATLASPGVAAKGSTSAVPAATAPFSVLAPAKRRRAAASAADVEPGPPSALPSFSADGPLPISADDLRACVSRFVCCSSAFGPLPMSAAAVNAALRREYVKAGHLRSGLGVFRASDTAQALRAIHRSLEALQSGSALVLDDASDCEDLLIVDADPIRIYSALHSSELDGASAQRWPKRARLSGGSAEAAAADFSVGGGAVVAVHTVPPGAVAPHFAAAAAGAGMGLASSHAADSDRPTIINRPSGLPPSGDVDSVEDLLKAPTARQRHRIEAGEELRILLAEPTARQAETARKFMNKTQNMAQFCPHGSRADCRRATGCSAACSKIHFKKIIKPWTDETLGDCSYLDTCRHVDKCKYVHYALDLTVDQAQYLNECGVQNRGTDTKRINEVSMKGMELPPQWIQGDLKVFPLSIFNGLIDVVMADPPWDIHMELPYGTLTDDEVRNLKIGDIHKDGMIFLWVTGRAMELARDCFRIWGYKRIEEIIWVKTNQLQRIIRTGRTGHWINHSKEHCLVGIKGNPKVNRNLDCDVIVSEVRETSRKPDEIYNLIERMFPNCMKLELFGRPHNVHENWITCGDQLDGVRICDEEMVRRYNQHFPDKPTTPYKREREAIVPVAAGSASSDKPAPAGARPGGAGDDVPWIPPSTWTPPAAPPVGYPPAGHSGYPPPPGPPGYTVPGPWTPHPPAHPGHGFWGGWR